MEELNLTELLACAEAQGLGTLSRALPRRKLEKLVDGEMEPVEADLSGTLQIREHTQHLIEKYRQQVTLPTSKGGKPCNGRCTEYGCPEVIAVNCFLRMGK